MFRTTGLIGAVLGLALSAGAADAGGRSFRSRCTSTVVEHADYGHHSSGFSFSISTSSGHGYGHRQSDWFGYGGSHHGHRSLAHRVYSHDVYYHRPVHTTVVVERPVCPPPAVIVERPYCPTPVVVERPVYIDRPVVQPVVREVPVYREIERDPYAEHRVGWDALFSADYQFARDYFEREVTQRPNDPVSRVGFALALAASGLDDQADWAMRRASRAGLDRARGQVPVGRLDHLLRALEQRYSERSFEYNDRWFMVASLRYVQGDTPGAGRAADEALRADPHDDDARRLYQIARYGA